MAADVVQRLLLLCKMAAAAVQWLSTDAAKWLLLCKMAAAAVQKAAAAAMQSLLLL